MHIHVRLYIGIILLLNQHLPKLDFLQSYVITATYINNYYHNPYRKKKSETLWEFSDYTLHNSEAVYQVYVYLYC